MPGSLAEWGLASARSTRRRPKPWRRWWQHCPHPTPQLPAPCVWRRPRPRSHRLWLRPRRLHSKPASITASTTPAAHGGRLAPLQAQAAAAARWAAALPALRAALLPDPGPSAQPDPATDWPAWLIWHRHRWLDQRPTALPPDLSARYHLLRLRAEVLEAEAAALAALLTPTASG